MHHVIMRFTLVIIAKVFIKNFLLGLKGTSRDIYIFLI
jgi:hypothetical protein